MNGYRDVLASALEGDPTHVLLSDASKRLTRREILAEVDSMGDRLVEAGCGPETLVALHFDPGVDSILSILSVLSVGAAYLPLDPRHGEMRVEQTLAAATPDFLLTAGGLKCLVDVPPQKPSAGLDDLAYVISTSGSTGVPKAAQLEQRGLVVHTKAMIELFELGRHDVVLQTAPPSFDIAVWQCTTPIVAGARTHVADDEQRLNPKALWSVLIEERVTVTQLVPSMIRIMLDCAVSPAQLSLRHVVSTGEALDPALANKWFATYPDLPLINLYGPAECSDDVSVHVLTGPVDPNRPVPIGRSFAGAVLRLVDDAGAEVGSDQTGQLQVCGDVVGRGYRNDPERTAAAFGSVFIDGSSLRSYDTGDLAYFDDHGLLRYVGRSDFQVKIRGNRVELGEIESVVAGHPGIDVCVVTKFDDGTDRLVAHCQTVDSAANSAERVELRRLTADALPSYMVPSAFVMHDRLPLNANGKIDRKRLPAPTTADLGIGSASSGRSARTPTERAIARSWAALLGLDEVPVDADFFDLGGTSLLAVISIDDLSRELGLEVPTRTLITGGTIERIAASLDADVDSAVDPDATGLVQIQDDPAGVPLFIYPGEAVSALGIVELGRRLEAGRSVYLFEPARPTEGQPGPTMATLAERCREAIASVCPEGPVHLAGFCMGGDVAWEIAHQRTQRGEITASVVLLQTERDGTYPSWPETVSGLRIVVAKIWQRARYEIDTMRTLGPAQHRSHVRHLMIGKAISKLTIPIEKRLYVSGLGPKIGIRRSLRLRQHLWSLVDRAAYEGWQPQALEVPVLVVRATEQPPLIESDQLLGWGSTGSADMTPREVAGFHWSFLHLPAVIELAAVVSEELNNRDPLLP